MIKKISLVVWVSCAKFIRAVHQYNRVFIAYISLGRGLYRKVLILKNKRKWAGLTWSKGFPLQSDYHVKLSKTGTSIFCIWIVYISSGRDLYRKLLISENKRKWGGLERAKGLPLQLGYHVQNDKSSHKCNRAFITFTSSGHGL